VASPTRRRTSHLSWLPWLPWLMMIKAPRARLWRLISSRGAVTVARLQRCGAAPSRIVASSTRRCTCHSLVIDDRPPSACASRSSSSSWWRCCCRCHVVQSYSSCARHAMRGNADHVVLPLSSWFCRAVVCCVRGAVSLKRRGAR